MWEKAEEWGGWWSTGLRPAQQRALAGCQTHSAPQQMWWAPLPLLSRRAGGWVDGASSSPPVGPRAQLQTYLVPFPAFQHFLGTCKLSHTNTLTRLCCPVSWMTPASMVAREMQRSGSWKGPMGMLGYAEKSTHCYEREQWERWVMLCREIDPWIV